MPRSVTRKDRQEVTFRPKQKYKERETELAVKGWVGGKRRVQGKIEKREKDRRAESEEEWKEKKSSKLVCSTQQPTGGTKGE